MSTASVVCGGFGPDGSIGGIVTFGFDIGTPPPVPALPNARLTLTPERVGWAGATFEDITDVDDDVFAFDVIDLLGAAIGSYGAETVASVAFDIIAADTLGNIDAGVSGRLIGAPVIIGTAVAQRFGNWVSGLSIRYRIRATVTTSRNNVFACWSYVSVDPEY